jgi:hypothetical protein
MCVSTSLKTGPKYPKIIPKRLDTLKRLCHKITILGRICNVRRVFLFYREQSIYKIQDRKADIRQVEKIFEIGVGTETERQK